MGTMTFHLPAGTPPEAARELGRACLAGGPDSMPWATRARLDGDVLRLTRNTDESGFLAAPCQVPELGWLMVHSGTLMERDRPYLLLAEQARGKVNQLRCQAADWQAGGLEMAEDVAAAIHRASLTFGTAVCSESPVETAELARQAIGQAAAAGDDLVRLYCSQVFRIRHQRHQKL